MRSAYIVGLGAAAALAAHQLFRWNRRRLRALRQAGHTKLELLPGERADILCMSPATSTVTLYDGDFAAAAEHLIKRVDEMVAANPWLAAVLDYDAESGELNAYIPPDAASRKLFEVLEGVALSGEYGPLVKSLEPAICVKPSIEAAGTGAPLFSVRLLRDLNAERRFALVVSANHSLIDGHGFYRLYNMLSSESKVEALDPTRKQELPARMLAAMGDEPSPMTACPPGFLASFVFAQVRSQLFPRTKAIGFDISPEWLAAQKATAAGGGVPFVSTNDCIVSCFLNCLDADCGLMPVNFRGKLDGCEEDNAGNYEDLITYMRPDYAMPALIRKSVGVPGDRRYRRAAEPPTAMLTNTQWLGGATVGVMTNWATFARPLSLPGATQELHLPLFDFPKANPASIMGSMVVFQPASGRVAAMVAGSQRLIDAVAASGIVGKSVGVSYA